MESEVIMGVLLTHARHRATLVATRSLGRAGIDVITSDSIRYATSFFSKYSKSKFIYPSPESKPELFIYSIKQYIQKCDIDVLIPIGECETYLISKHKKEIDKIAKVPIPEYEIITKANNKRYMIDLARKIGVNVPQTYIVNDMHDIETISKELIFPVVIKPVFGSGAEGIRFVNSEDELLREYHNVMRKFNYSEYPLIQEFILGDSYCVGMLFNRGELRALCAYRNIRKYPISGGPSTTRISVRHAKMEKYAAMLLEEIQYHGVGEVEFILNRKTGEPVLMDVNPRFWGSLYQSICAGVDFPYLLYKMAMEGDVKSVFTYKVGVKTRWMLGDLRALADYIMTKKRKEVLKDFFKLHGNNLHYDDVSAEDPIPTLIEFMIPLMNLLKSGNLKFSPENIGR